MDSCLDYCRWESSRTVLFEEECCTSFADYFWHCRQQVNRKEILLESVLKALAIRKFFLYSQKKEEIKKKQWSCLWCGFYSGPGMMKAPFLGADCKVTFQLISTGLRCYYLIISKHILLSLYTLQEQLYISWLCTILTEVSKKPQAAKCNITFLYAKNTEASHSFEVFRKVTAFKPWENTYAGFSFYY